MSQVFSADAQLGLTTGPLVGTTETEIMRTNALQPPFGTCKAKVLAVVQINPGADVTGFFVRIYRNPDKENLLVNSFGGNFGAGKSNTIVCGGVDNIPDGRSVVYRVTAQQDGGVADGSFDPENYVEATLISG